MPRLPRIYIEDAVYYVTCRGIHHQNIFKDERDYQMFLELLNKYQQQYGIKLFSYVLLPDHLHLLLELAGDRQEISGFMHDLNNTYTKYFNSRYDRKGHLFQGRFKSALVEKAPNLVKLTAYMHLNPKRLHLVTDAKEYQHGSYKGYLDPGVAKQFNLEQEIAEVLSLLKDKGYAELVDGLTPEEGNKLHKRLQRGGIVGSNGFVKNVKDKVANFQSRISAQESAAKQSRYRLFILSGSFLLIIVAGLSGVYFYFTARDTDGPIDAQPAVSGIMNLGYLNSTEWDIETVPFSGEGTIHKDTLSFRQGRFSSAVLNDKGYAVSNYTLIQENGKIIWETMQTSPDGSTASWRGEVQQDKMRGILSLRQKGEKPQDFSFMSMRHRGKE
jgi:putative transposase